MAFILAVIAALVLLIVNTNQAPPAPAANTVRPHATLVEPASRSSAVELADENIGTETPAAEKPSFSATSALPQHGWGRRNPCVQPDGSMFMNCASVARRSVTDGNFDERQIITAVVRQWVP